MLETIQRRAYDLALVGSWVAVLLFLYFQVAPPSSDKQTYATIEMLEFAGVVPKWGRVGVARLVAWPRARRALEAQGLSLENENLQLTASGMRAAGGNAIFDAIEGQWESTRISIDEARINKGPLEARGLEAVVSITSGALEQLRVRSIAASTQTLQGLGRRLGQRQPRHPRHGPRLRGSSAGVAAPSVFRARPPTRVSAAMARLENNPEPMLVLFSMEAIFPTGAVLRARRVATGNELWRCEGVEIATDVGRNQYDELDFDPDTGWLSEPPSAMSRLLRRDGRRILQLGELEEVVGQRKGQTP